MFRMHEYPINNFLDQLKAKYREAGKDVTFIPFAYNADFLPLNLSSSLPFVNTTDYDSDFLVLAQLQTTFTTAGVFTANPQITARITHEVSGRRFEDRDTALSNIFGRGTRPFYLIRPMEFPAKTSWTTTLTNQDSVNNFNVRLTYWGVKAVPTPFR